jgi:hypothetical protein
MKGVPGARALRIAIRLSHGLTADLTVCERSRVGNKELEMNSAGAFHISVWSMLLLHASNLPDARAETRVIDFDPPNFSVNQVVHSANGVTFPDAPIVFAPATIGTFSPPHALRSAQACNDVVCSNGANTLKMEFPVGVSALSVRAGSDESTVSFCFPEGTACPYVARLIGYDAGGTPIAASADTMVASWAATPPGFGSITTELSITDSAARIRSAILYIGRDLLKGSDIGGRVQVDHVKITIPDSPPPEAVPSPEPVLEITSPGPGRCFDWSYDVKLAGKMTLSNLLDLCTTVNNGTPLCGQGIHVAANGSFTSHVNSLDLRQGLNTVRATASYLGGKQATDVVEIELSEEYYLGNDGQYHLREDDLRIIGMEVTQGIQREAVQLNTGAAAQYNGVKLVQGGKTIVRVFANRSGGRCGPEPDISVLLTATAPDPKHGLKTLGSLFPDVMKRALHRGTLSVTPDERADPDGAFVFTLPSSWTMHGSMNLTATISQFFRYPKVNECAACLANNTMSVESVHFAVVSPIVISPVELVWTDPTTKLVQMPRHPADVFSRAAHISPLHETGLDVRPYAGQVDITDLVDKARDSTGRVVADKTLVDGVWNRVRQFELTDLPGLTIGVVSGLDVGLEAPVVYAWPPRIEPIALVDDGVERPLTNVAHEFYHSLSFYHAGEKCGGCEVFPSVSWPPDGRGRIGGIGLDRRKDSAGLNRYRVIAPGAPGQPGEWVDLMSYCLGNRVPWHGDFNAWISIRNWEAFGGALPSGAIPTEAGPFGCAEMEVTTAASARITVTPADKTLRISAMIEPGPKAKMLAVERGNGPAVSAAAASSRYRVVAKNGAGEIVSSTPVSPLALLKHGERSGVVSAEVPDHDTEVIEIRHDDVVLASRTRSMSPPRVSIVSPEPGDRVIGTQNVTVRWRAVDQDGDTLEASVEYSADDGRSFKLISSGVVGDRITIPGKLLSFSEEARVRVIVNDGFNEAQAISGRFLSTGVAPDVRIIDPHSETSISEGVELHLVGNAYDDRGNPINSYALEWFDGEKALGRGRQLSVPGLTPGPHDIRLRAHDSLGRSNSASIAVRVMAASPPSSHVRERTSELVKLIASYAVSEGIKNDLVRKAREAVGAVSLLDVETVCTRFRDISNDVKSLGVRQIDRRRGPIAGQIEQTISILSELDRVVGCPSAP